MYLKLLLAFSIVKIDLKYRCHMHMLVASISDGEAKYVDKITAGGEWNSDVNSLGVNT